MLKNYIIGILGPATGLTDFQTAALREEIRQALLCTEEVHLHVWRDTRSRHPIETNPDGMIASADQLRYKLERTHLVWHEYYEVAVLEPLTRCDLLFFCPGHAHTSTQKSRVWTMKRFADTMTLKSRILFAWKHETNHP